MTNHIKLVFIPLFFFVFLSEISAQISVKKPDLKKEKDISWIGETEFIYQLEHHDRMTFTPTGKTQEETRLIKIDPAATCNYGSEKFLTFYLLNAVQQGKIKAHSEDGQPLSVDEVDNKMGFSSIDTVITFDPETLEETFAVVRTDPSSNITSFKIKQWWYFNKTTNSFSSIVKAVGPLKDILSNDGTSVVRTKLLFWIDVEQAADQDFNFNQANVIWAKETINSVSFEDSKKIKGNKRKTFKNLAFQHPKKGKSQVLENESWYAYCAESISKDDVNKLLSASKDSIITYDPETYKETIDIIKTPKVKFKDFKHYRVHQHWYFDKTQNILASKLITIGPLWEVNDEKGKLKYRKALYYIRGEQE